MKTFLKLLLAVFLLAGLGFSQTAEAIDYSNHKGFYIYGMGGFMDASHDTNVRTNQSFGSAVIPGFGLTSGYNFTDWIAAELQIAYGTATGTTPSGNGREHLLNIRLNAKYSFLTKKYAGADWKILPYVKAGGVAHGLFVNAPNTNDKVGAFGGGVGLGGGLEVNYKALYLGLDLSNDLIFLSEQRRTIAGVDTLITAGGFDYQISLMAAVGVHF